MYSNYSVNIYRRNKIYIAFVLWLQYSAGKFTLLFVEKFSAKKTQWLRARKKHFHHLLHHHKVFLMALDLQVLHEFIYLFQTWTWIIDALPNVNQLKDKWKTHQIPRILINLGGGCFWLADFKYSSNTPNVFIFCFNYSLRSILFCIHFHPDTCCHLDV